MADDFEEFLEAFKKRHVDWFGVQMVNSEPEAPKRPAPVAARPIVEAPKRAYWDHDDEGRNDA